MSGFGLHRKSRGVLKSRQPIEINVAPAITEKITFLVMIQLRAVVGILLTIIA